VFVIQGNLRTGGCIRENIQYARVMYTKEKSKFIKNECAWYTFERYELNQM
jgi:hypothetical protein